MKLEDLTQAEIDALDKLVLPKKVNILSMSVGDVLQCITSEQSLCDYVNKLDCTIIDKYSFVKGFMNEINAVFKSFEQYNSSVPIEYQSALMTTKGLSTAETILIDCINFYHLHSAKEAEKLPFGDWFLMKRNIIINNCIDRKYQENINKKQERRYR